MVTPLVSGEGVHDPGGESVAVEGLRWGRCRGLWQGAVRREAGREPGGCEGLRPAGARVAAGAPRSRGARAAALRPGEAFPPRLNCWPLNGRQCQMPAEVETLLGCG